MVFRPRLRSCRSSSSRLLDNNDVVGSVGRVGGACHNVAAESFFSLTPTGHRQAHSGRVDLLGTKLAAAIRVQNRHCWAPERDGVADRGRRQSSSDKTHLVPLRLTHADMGI